MDSLVKAKLTTTEIIRINKEKEKERRREQKAECYRKNRYTKKKLSKTKTPSETKSAIKQRCYNKRIKQQKLQENIRKENRRNYMKDYRRRRRADITSTPKSDDKILFSNRMDKARSIKKLKQALPLTPNKRAAVLSAYVECKRISKSPGVEKFHASFEESVEKIAIRNVQEVITSVKHKRNGEAKAALNILTSSVSGQNISERKGAVNSLAKKLGVNCRTLQKGKRIRTKVLHSDHSSFLYTTRKTRSDALTERTKKIVHDFWLQSNVSRPTNNKNDIKRVRISPKVYSSHSCYILEKTQTEIFLQFKNEYPDIKIGQRAFEKCKPYFVRTAQFKDKVTCCCRQHVEMRSLFKTCMQFRKRLLSREGSDEVKLYESLSELVDDTLCPRSANTHQHKISCLDRQCSECGVRKFTMLPGELDESDVQVSWERYEYKNVNVKGDKMIRKLVLVRKSSSPVEMFRYLNKLLETFPAHQFRAYWQSKQMKSLLENLPLGHCVAIHDFSENYKCTEQNEIQSSYFQKLEVSLHVTILHRHSVLEYDEKDSTAEEPNIVTEQFLVISPDQKHDHHFTNCVQKLLSEYLSSINCEISVMHEFTDGCSSQYKSRHCMGDVSYSCYDFGYSKVIRNFFETSHARGPQDAAGGFIKKQADLAVIRGTHVIQSSRDLFDFAQSNLSTTAHSSKCSRRLFRYVDSVNRDRDRNFLPVKDNRKIHQVRSSVDGEIFVRRLSCYSCENCIVGNYNMCLNDAQMGTFLKIKMVKESELNESDYDSDDDERDDEEADICDLVSSGTILAVKADDNDYPYYLVRASKHQTVLRKTATDKWGVSYHRGTKVIHGYYFDTIDHNPLKLKLLKRIPAIVPALSVIYICSEVDIDDNGVVNLNESLHGRILRCLE